MPLTRKALTLKNRGKKSIHSIENIVGIIGLFITFTVALQAAKFGNLATILGAIAAALTVAVGFGMREQIGNLVAGILVQLDNPFVKNDYIQVNEYEGEVKEIKLRATILKGSKAEKLVIPNGYLTNNPVKNYTKGNTTKTKIELKVPAEDGEKLGKKLKKEAEEHDKVLDKPESQINFKELEEGNIVLELFYWIRDSTNVNEIKSSILKSFIEDKNNLKYLKNGKD